jgi:iron complex transport system ATP-binding protein
LRIAVDGVTFRHPPAFSLGPVSVSVEPGEWLGLVGPNGSGKTTLLRILAGTDRPHAGSVSYDGTPVGAMDAVQLSKLRAVVPQRLAVPFDLEVRAVVELGRLSHLSPGARLLPLRPTERGIVDACLSVTDTDHLARRSLRTLSGGEQQRVLLAMALAQEAPVLLLDEPTASLDPGHARRFLDLVADLVAGGKTVVMAHHDLTTVAQACHRILLLVDGRVEGYGDVDAVMTSERLTGVYQTPLGVMRHPDTGRPLVFHRD